MSGSKPALDQFAGRRAPGRDAGPDIDMLTLILKLLVGFAFGLVILALL